MKRAGPITLCALALFSILGGCQTSEQTLGGAGAAVGAVACGLIGRAVFHSTAGTAGSAAACGVAGFFIGSAIGRQMDERDRTKATAATQQALAVPISYPPTRTAALHPAVRPVNWASDHGTGVRGSSGLVAVEPQKGGGECREVREIAYIKGKEETQQSKYCRDPGGDWVSA